MFLKVSFDPWFKTTDSLWFSNCKVFQILGPYDEKARSPNERIFVRGTTCKSWSEEHNERSGVNSTKCILYHTFSEDIRQFTFGSLPVSEENTAAKQKLAPTGQNWSSNQVYTLPSVYSTRCIFYQEITKILWCLIIQSFEHK